jgi:hypothetical protein
MGLSENQPEAHKFDDSSSVSLLKLQFSGIYASFSDKPTITKQSWYDPIDSRRLDIHKSSVEDGGC